MYILHSNITEEVFNNLSELEKDELIISSDEIISYKIKLEPTEDDFIPLPPTLTLQIKGALFGHVSKDEAEQSELKIYQESLKGNVLELGSAWNNVEEEYINRVKALIKRSYSTIDLNTKTLSDNIIYANSSNRIKLTQWSTGFMKSDYRNVILEVDNSGCNEIHFMSDMFVASFNEEHSIKNGNGEYNLFLKQRINHHKPYEYYYSFGEEKPIPVNLLERSEPRNFKVEVPKNDLGLETEILPLVATTGIIGTEVLTEEEKEEQIAEEIEVKIFDVNDNHVKFLLGQTSTTVIHSSTIKQDTDKEIYDFLKSSETLYVGSKNDLKSLFGERIELTRKEIEESEELGQLETLEIDKYKNINNSESVANLPNNIKGGVILANIISDKLEQVTSKNILNVTKLKIEKKLKGDSSILEDDYFIFKIEQEENKYLLIGMSKSIHYGRNKYQEGKIPTLRKELEKVEGNKDLEDAYIKIHSNELLHNRYYFKKRNTFYQRLGVFKSMYHGLENEKFVNMDTGFYVSGLYEVVFNVKGELVLNSEDIGTFNFYSPNNGNAHTMYDVVPYWLWGNSPQDTSKLLDRFGAKGNVQEVFFSHPFEGMLVRNVLLFRAIDNLKNFKKNMSKKVEERVFGK